MKEDKDSQKDEAPFIKNGQIKVSQNPENGFRKLAENEKEFGVDDLVEQSNNMEAENVDEEC